MKKYLLFLASAVILFSAFRNKDIIITGTITEQQGNPVAGAAITAGKFSSSSDANGAYTITVNAQTKSMVVSMIGYLSQTIKIDNKTVINVKLKPTVSTLDEVVVVGYGTQKKMTMTGSVNMLSGKAAGLVISSSNGYSNAPVISKSLRTDDEFNTEEYSNIAENGFHKVTDDPVSTFSIDVDAGSYSNVRRFLNEEQLPPAGAVRTEEMINYFKYDYPQPTGNDPFSINTEISDCPWNKDNKLVLIGLQGKSIPVDNLPASNLVFLIDVSGSMEDENKLPLVKASLKMLTEQLREKDRISIVVYAGNAGLVLPSTSGADKMKIKTAIDELEAGGSTAGGAGIKLAYKIAQENLIAKGNNRIILCTDGDFNVGASSDDDMARLVEGERNKGVYLTVLGYGMGNYKDSKMEELADKGNGNHAYIDGINEAKKVLVNEFGGTLFTIAKDVKLQVEFNPEKVAGYRLIGYENRLLNKEDFNNDKKDAGELGSGHTVTALYEVIPAGVESEYLHDVDELKYQPTKKQKVKAGGDEILTVKFRYKAPDKDSSELIVHAVKDVNTSLKNTSANFRFAASVAGFAMLLRNSEYKGEASYKNILSMAGASLGADKEGYRKEFVTLVQKAQQIAKSTAKVGTAVVEEDE